MEARVAGVGASFLLVEDSGDSEADLGPGMGVTAYLADDDAESCSWDVMDQSQACDLNGDNNVEGQVGVIDDVDKTPSQEKEEEEIRGYHETWSGGGVGGHVNKSRVSVESTNEPMTDKEKNRLFWEACLAPS